MKAYAISPPRVTGPASTDDSTGLPEQFLTLEIDANDENKATLKTVTNKVEGWTLEPVRLVIYIIPISSARERVRVRATRLALVI